MLTLGIETSTRPGGAALLRDGECLEECPLESEGRRHAQALASEVDALLEKHDLAPSDIDAVAVSIGPGSFTGLRIGVVFAKTFAYVTGCSVAAVDTFLAVAANSPADASDVWVIGDAQRQQLYAGRYVRDPGGTWTQQGAIAIVDTEPWCRERQAGDIVSGPGVSCCAELFPEGCRVLDEETRLPRASIVARLGSAEIEAGRAEDLWTLEPVYLRQSAAEEKAEAREKRS